MNHLSEIELAKWVDDQVPAGEAEEHVRHCDVCQRELERLRAVAHSLRGVVDRLGSGSTFVGEVATRIDAAPTHRQPLGFLAALGAIGVIVLIAPRFFQQPPDFVARGGTPTDGASAYGVDFFTQEPGEASRPLRPGVNVSSTAGFAFVARTHRPVELMIFALDSLGQVHWFYPVFHDAGSDPRSLTLTHTQALPDAVAPEDAARGRFELVAIFSEVPLRVSQVEALVAQGGIAALRAEPRMVVKTLDVQRPAPR